MKRKEETEGQMGGGVGAEEVRKETRGQRGTRTEGRKLQLSRSSRVESTIKYFQGYPARVAQITCRRNSGLGAIP